MHSKSDVGSDLMTRDERIQLLAAGLIALPVDLVDIARANHSAFKRVDYTVNRKNLPLRDKARKFDDAVMGEIATNALISYLRKNFAIPAISYEDLRVDSSQINDSGWDVLLLPTIGIDGNLGGKAQLPIVTMSVKSSRIPKNDKDDLVSALSRWDFKTLKYHEDSIREDLQADIWIQVYYPLQESSADNLDWNAAQDVLNGESLSKEGSATLYRALRLHDRFAHPTVVGLTTSQKIIDYVSLCSNKTDYMYVGGEKKPIWPSKIAAIGQPLANLPAIVKAATGSIADR